MTKVKRMLNAAVEGFGSGRRIIKMVIIILLHKRRKGIRNDKGKWCGESTISWNSPSIFSTHVYSWRMESAEEWRSGSQTT